MKKILIVLFILLFSSCINFDEDINKSNDSTIKEKISANSISSEKEKKKRLEYKHENIEGFQRDNSLYVERMMGDYPNDISTSSNEPYAKDELKNLDYDKNVFLEAFNIRIPNRCKVYSNTSNKNTYVIDFPKSDDYDLSINIKKLLEEGKKSEDEIKNELYKISDKETYNSEIENANVVQKPVGLESDYKKTYYSIVEDNKFSYTNIFMATPTNILQFQIVEDKEKSQASPYIMADLLSTTYPESEDFNMIAKSFKSFDKYINLYATEKIDMGDFSFNIPQDMKNIQESEALTVYENQLSGKTINQIIISKIKKDRVIDLKNSFAQSQGSQIPPAFISPMGEVKEEMVKEKLFLKSKVRIYTEQFSLEGEKIAFETKDYFVNIILAGPLKNTNKTQLLNENIINSLKFE
ncbi:MAG: hypothetical protein E7I57_06620 [Anaerococcus vaginalis]|uniref:hypothetical protein n=1 Tax=Anaerococcus vaginalis TaxID=33037 RepID=UPI00288A8B90|nr:hypothetical protein [Anaerococcus vaginalis]MDU4379091.1 hypothetical protein [Anaerococcus vaginalis]MDU7141976.1 hypothetical protein [Anaerococcus vaginalis]MDU7650523.1 hypothetical protein [Anaerococcus vaginalis]